MSGRPAAKTTLHLVHPAAPAPGGISGFPAPAAAPREQVADRPRPEISTRPAELGPRAQRPCRCGHQREAHRHYRNGTDCGTCGCERFSAAPGRLGTLVGAVLHRVRSHPTAPDRP